MKRTEWFSARTRPVHVGWYEILLEGLSEIEMALWTGRNWLGQLSDGSPISSAMGIWPDDKWRGLTERSEG